MGNEVQDFHDKISIVSQLIESSEINFKEIIDNMVNCDPRDRPDGLLLIGNIVYILEHFEMSIFKNTKRKGDALKSVEKIPVEKIKKDVQLHPKKYNLINNLEKGLLKHANSFEVYFEEATKQFPNKEYKLILLIEDNSNDIVVNSEGEDINILSVLETLCLLINYQDIAGVINYNTSPRGNYMIANDTKVMQRKLLYVLPIKDTMPVLTPELVSAFTKSIQSLIMLSESATMKDTINVTKSI